MTEFNVGDKVLVNGQVATIVNIDASPGVDRLIYETYPAGGGTDTVYAHVSNSRIEALPAGAAETVVEDYIAVAEPVAEPEAKK